MSTRRSSQRRGRGVGLRAPEPPPESGEGRGTAARRPPESGEGRGMAARRPPESGEGRGTAARRPPAPTEAVDAVRQQLQVKVADSLVSRGVNTADRWQAKPTGQLTSEEQKRLDRQRANKRRWAQKERERSKTEMEALKKQNADLETKHRELQGQVDQLRKLKYSLKTVLADHECKSLAPKVKSIRPPKFPPRKTSKTKVISNGETSCALASGHLGCRFDRIPKSTNGQRKRLVRTKASGWKRMDRTLAFKQSGETTSATGDGSPRRSHDPISIDAILKSASNVSAAVTLRPQHTTTNSEQAPAEDDQDPSDNQVQQDYLGSDGGLTGQTLQSEGFGMTEVTDFCGSYLQMLQEDEFSSSDIQPISVTPQTRLSWTNMDDFMPVAIENSVIALDIEMEEEPPTDINGEHNSASSSDSLMYNATSVSEDVDTHLYNSQEHKNNGGKCTIVSHTDSGPGTKAEDIYITELTLNDTWVTEGRHVKPISGDCEDHNTALNHLSSNSCHETSSTAADQSSELIMWSESNACRNDVSCPAATTSKGGSHDARDHTMTSAVPKPSSFLPDRTTPASATTKHYLETRSKDTLFKTPSTNPNNSQKRSIMDLPVKLNREADKICPIFDTSNTRTEHYKRSTSWENNWEKTEGSTKRSRCLSFPTSLSRNSLHVVSNTAQDTTDMNKNDDNLNHRSATNVQMTTTASRVEEDGVQPLTMTLTSSSPSAVSSGDILLTTESIILVAPNQVPLSPSTSSSPELTSPFLTRGGADRNVDEGPGDSSVVMIEVTGDEVTDGSFGDLLHEMPVFPEDVVESVLQMLEQAS